MPRPGRDEAAAALAARELEAEPSTGRVLVVGDPRDEVTEAARAGGATVEHWDRLARTGSGRAARPWVPEGPFGLGALRLPTSWPAFEMAVHAVLGVLEPGARLLVYGANDEGVRSAPRRLEPLVGRVGTLAVGGHARLLGAVRPATVAGLRPRLADWRETVRLELPWGPLEWVSYPGVFAHGRLDDGTALLLEHLPPVADGQRVLDFGAGSGVLGAALLREAGGLDLTLLEIDALAAEAARENVPSATVCIGDGWAALAADARYDVVVANPPYHRGKDETLVEVEALVAGAAARLARGGVLRLVVQRRHPVGDLLERHFDRVRAVADGGPYRVWEGSASSSSPGLTNRSASSPYCFS